ncbi:MAG TPA: hypothetical protein ENK04_13055 [Gammaproteobacteria bacterium]|nr:hypothetical protein [Gammaproteobacteria bacterium]
MASFAYTGGKNINTAIIANAADKAVGLKRVADFNNVIILFLHNLILPALPSRNRLFSYLILVIYDKPAPNGSGGQALFFIRRSLAFQQITSRHHSIDAKYGGTNTVGLNETG